LKNPSSFENLFLISCFLNSPPFHGKDLVAIGPNKNTLITQTVQYVDNLLRGVTAAFQEGSLESRIENVQDGTNKILLIREQDR
jgi:hypothetical protein